MLCEQKAFTEKIVSVLMSYLARVGTRGGKSMKLAALSNLCGIPR